MATADENAIACSESGKCRTNSRLLGVAQNEGRSRRSTQVFDSVCLSCRRRYAPSCDLSRARSSKSSCQRLDGLPLISSVICAVYQNASSGLTGLPDVLLGRACGTATTGSAAENILLVGRLGRLDEHLRRRCRVAEPGRDCPIAGLVQRERGRAVDLRAKLFPEIVAGKLRSVGQRERQPAVDRAADLVHLPVDALVELDPDRHRRSPRITMTLVMPSNE